MVSRSSFCFGVRAWSSGTLLVVFEPIDCKAMTTLYCNDSRDLESISYIRHEDFLRPSSFVLLLRQARTTPPLKSEMGLTGEL